MQLFYFYFIIINIENRLVYFTMQSLLFFTQLDLIKLLTCWCRNALTGRSSIRKSFQFSIFVFMDNAQWIAYFQYRFRRKPRLIEQLHAASLVASLHVYYTFTLSPLDAGQWYIPRFVFFFAPFCNFFALSLVKVQAYF